MSDRWKFQLKTGIFWGLFMIVAMTLFEWKEKPIMEELASPKFYLKLVIYLAAGIFGLGYFNWKEKLKHQNKQ